MLGRKAWLPVRPSGHAGSQGVDRGICEGRDLGEQPQGRRAEGPSPPCRSWSQLGWLLAWSDPESHTQAPQDSMWVTGAAGQPSASSCLTPVPSSPAGRVQLPLPPAFSSPFEQTKPQMVGELCATSSCPCPPWLAKKLFQKERKKEQIFFLLSKRKSSEAWAAGGQRALLSRRFFYSTFLAAVTSLVAEGWEPPSVSGTCPSVTPSQCALRPACHHQHVPPGLQAAPAGLPPLCPSSPLAPQPLWPRLLGVVPATFCSGWGCGLPPGLRWGKRASWLEVGL